MFSPLCFAYLLIVFPSPILSTLSQGCCTSKWYGTAPFCNGECPQEERLVEYDDDGEGYGCWAGRKALCCPSHFDDNGVRRLCVCSDKSSPCYMESAQETIEDWCCSGYWSGTAPFCRGHCGTDKQVYENDSGDSGHDCVIGSKKLCCRMTFFDPEGQPQNCNCTQPDANCFTKQ